MISSKKIILISGNMGSGKTTLGKGLSERLGYRFFEEPVEKNPYLDKFFDNPKAGCFDLQVYFIEKRIQAMMEVSESVESCILDRSVFDSRDAYIPVHLKMGHILV